MHLLKRKCSKYSKKMYLPKGQVLLSLHLTTNFQCFECKNKTPLYKLPWIYDLHQFLIKRQVIAGKYVVYYKSTSFLAV